MDPGLEVGQLLLMRSVMSFTSSWSGTWRAHHRFIDELSTFQPTSDMGQLVVCSPQSERKINFGVLGPSTRFRVGIGTMT